MPPSFAVNTPGMLAAIGIVNAAVVWLPVFSTMLALLDPATPYGTITFVIVPEVYSTGAGRLLKVTLVVPSVVPTVPVRGIVPATSGAGPTVWPVIETISPGAIAAASYTNVTLTSLVDLIIESEYPLSTTPPSPRPAPYFLSSNSSRIGFVDSRKSLPMRQC